jgi:pyruvate dehydrogenase E1 component
VLFAYTVKGWGLHFAGDPMNHSALLTDADIGALRQTLGIPELDEWPALSPDSPGGRLAAERSKLFKVSREHNSTHIEFPDALTDRYAGSLSTQQVFGQVMTGLARLNSEAVSRIVTVSPDVATSTNLGGWINRVGVWESKTHSDLFADEGPRLVNWKRHPGGQHIELGISETNLLMLLGQLGLSAELFGEPLLPIGTLYDPFVARALDAYIYGVYSGARFILVGTPSGVTLAPEGGAHQSVLTPNVGLALPHVTYWEPCFARELEWILLEALRAIHRTENPESSYLRLTTLPVDQGLFPDTQDQSALRRSVLSGVYKIRDASSEARARPGNMVDIWATGVMVPTAIRAAEELMSDGVFASVYNCVSPGLVYRLWQQSVHSAMDHLSGMSSGSGSPVVTVIDGHPSALSWVGSMLGVRAFPLGVSDFGQSGLPGELHAHFKIDEDAISYAAYAALGGIG